MRYAVTPETPADASIYFFRKKNHNTHNVSVSFVLLYISNAWLLIKTPASGTALGRHQPRGGIHLSQLGYPDPPTSAPRLAAHRRVSCHGYTLRLQPEHPAHTTLNFDPRKAGWRRPRGASRAHWHNASAQQGLRTCGVSLARAEPLALNRPFWEGTAELGCFSRPDANVRITE